MCCKKFENRFTIKKVLPKNNFAKGFSIVKNHGREVNIRYGVNSYSSQFVLKSIRTHFGQFVLSFRSIRTHLIKFSQLVLILVDSYSVWSIRTHTKNMILIIYSILLMIDR